MSEEKEKTGTGEYYVMRDFRNYRA